MGKVEFFNFYNKKISPFSENFRNVEIKKKKRLEQITRHKTFRFKTLELGNKERGCLAKKRSIRIISLAV